MGMQIDRVLWAKGFPNAGVDPGKAYDAIEKIRQKNGGTCTDDDVVDAARSPRNPLHKLFEWDDTEAAREYRRDQARTILRMLRVVYAEPTVKEPTRAFEVIAKKPRSEGNQQRTLYSTREEAVKDPVSRAALLAEAISQLMAWRKRFQHLNELDRLLSVVDEEVDKLTQVPQ